MDLKSLLNQTTIGEQYPPCVTESVSVTESVIQGTNEPAELEEDEVIDTRFNKPWNKLEKGAKMNRIVLFIQQEKIDKDLNDIQVKDLKTLLFKGCGNGLFNKNTLVSYNEDNALIEVFKNLEFNETSKKYKLITNSVKNKSVTKSRSNLDRLTKKNLK